MTDNGNTSSAWYGAGLGRVEKTAMSRPSDTFLARVMVVMVLEAFVGLSRSCCRFIVQREKVKDIEPPELKECTFQPKIGNADDILVQTRPARLGETEQERYDRLSRGDSKQVDRVRAAISETYYAQFTYRPEINELSKVIDRRE